MARLNWRGFSGRPPLVNRGLALTFCASFAGITSFFLLLSVVPLYATSVGGGDVGAGLSTAVLMLSTVGTELAVPRLVAALGHRLVLAAGLVLLGAPAFVLPIATSLPAILAVSLVRGVGFAIVVVLANALVARYVPSGRRGEGLGLFGVVAGVPFVLALPAGVWLAENVGYLPVFVAAGLVAVLGVLAVPGLPGREATAGTRQIGMLRGLRTAALLRPALAFAGTATAVGVVVTFVPLALTRNQSAGSAGLAAFALLVQASASTVARWCAGRYGDRHGAAPLLVPSIVTSAVAMVIMVFIANPVAVVAGMLVFGIGLGVTQNVSLTVMFDRAEPESYGMVSALWNLAYDFGLGFGAIGFGVLAPHTGYPAGFAIVAVVVLLGVIPARVGKQHDAAR